MWGHLGNLVMPLSRNENKSILRSPKHRNIILLVFPLLCFSKSLLVKVVIDNFIILLPLTNCLQPITHYLVKWRSQPYEESTWEIEVKFTKQY